MNVKCAASQLGTSRHLDSNKVHLWLADYNEISDASLVSIYRDMLSSAERVQESRFYFERDRRRFLITRALVRTVLSRYFDVQPANWIFSQNDYGCPYVVNSEAVKAGLSFNISHTHSMIVLGVTKDRSIGVDIENINARKISSDALVSHFFSPSEVSDFCNTSQNQRNFRFFEYWTFKESYIKARKMGLSLPLDKFSFVYPSSGRVAIKIDTSLSDDPARWAFWQLLPERDYLLAICAERGSGCVPDLEIRKVVPLESDYAIALDILRASV